MSLTPSPSGHTPLDHLELMLAGVDPTTTQPRERPVMCRTCARPTLHQAGYCDEHYEPPAAIRRATRPAQ